MDAELLDALGRAETYPHHPAQVERIETHVSEVFLAGDRVFKLKRAVDLGFLDFRSLAERERVCAEELRLNRRLAPDTYLGVTAVRRRDDGRIAVDDLDAPGSGTVLDWAVVMRRLPAERMLDRLLREAAVDNGQMRALAQLLAEFHATAASGPDIDAFGSLETIRGNAAENFAQTEDCPAISPRLREFLAARCMGFLDAQAGLFDRRVAEGRIRDGHGDLHAGNICLTEPRITIYDCLEFAPRFRCADVAADLAFLLMDLDLHGFRAFAGYLQHEYVERSGDRELPALMGFYKGYRAYVRGKVAAMQEDMARAAGYFHLAASYELGPVLVLCCGLPGCGKSTRARALAAPFEAAIENSDLMRKRQVGVRHDQSAGKELHAGAYSAAQSAEVYAELLAQARKHLRSGRSVVVDAGLRRAAERRGFLALARELGRPYVLVHVATPEAETRRRLTARSEAGGSESDAGIAVYEAVKETFEAPEELGSAHLVVDDGSRDAAACVRDVLDLLVAQA